MLQSSKENQKKIGDQNGIDVLLLAIAVRFTIPFISFVLFYIYYFYLFLIAIKSYVMCLGIQKA